MINVLFSFTGQQTTKVTTTSTRAEIEALINMFGGVVQARWVSAAPESPVLITGAADEGIKAFLFDSLSQQGGTPPVVIQEPEPVDPRFVEIIDPDGDGYHAFPTSNDEWRLEALAANNVIYGFTAANREQVEDAIDLLDDQVTILNTFGNFLRSVVDVFPASANHHPISSESADNDLPDLTAPISKEKALSRLQKLLGPVPEQPTNPEPEDQNSIPGTFLFLKEGSKVPLQIMIHGDGERLKDIGFLDLVREKYPSDIAIREKVQNGIRTVSIRRHQAKRYIEIIRSVLLDCNLVQFYTIDSMEYQEHLLKEMSVIYL